MRSLTAPTDDNRSICATSGLGLKRLLFNSHVRNGHLGCTSPSVSPTLRLNLVISSSAGVSNLSPAEPPGSELSVSFISLLRDTSPYVTFSPRLRRKLYMYPSSGSFFWSESRKQSISSDNKVSWGGEKSEKRATKSLGNPPPFHSHVCENYRGVKCCLSPNFRVQGT